MCDIFLLIWTNCQKSPRRQYWTNCIVSPYHRFIWSRPLDQEWGMVWLNTEMFAQGSHILCPLSTCVLDIRIQNIICHEKSLAHICGFRDDYNCYPTWDLGWRFTGVQIWLWPRLWSHLLSWFIWSNSHWVTQTGFRPNSNRQFWREESGWLRCLYVERRVCLISCIIRLKASPF